MLCRCSVSAAAQLVTPSSVLHTSTDARDCYALGVDTLFIEGRCSQGWSICGLECDFYFGSLCGMFRKSEISPTIRRVGLKLYINEECNSNSLFLVNKIIEEDGKSAPVQITGYSE